MTEIKAEIVRIDGEWWGFDGEPTGDDQFSIMLPIKDGEEPWLEINGKAIPGERLTQVIY